MKKNMYAIMAMLAISLLTACGKSNNSTTAGVYGGGYYTNIGTGANGIGQGCYNLGAFYQQTNGQQAFQATFAGQGQAYGNVVQAQMLGSQTGLNGSQFSRNNGYDSMQMGINGNVATAVVSLHPQTVYVLASRGLQLCGISVNSTVAGNGQLVYSAQFIVSNGGSMGLLPQSVLSL